MTSRVGTEPTRIEDFSLTVDDLTFIAPGLKRPECVLATSSGDIFVADGRGGIATVRPGGGVELVLAKNPPEGFLPNGIALMRDRGFLIADIGPEGGIWHMGRDGTLTPRLREVDGRRLPATNFVYMDEADRVWITVSTWHVRREEITRKGHADGFVVLMDRRGARIVADRIGYTNEAKVDPSGRWLYVNETIGRRLTRFPIRPDSSLGKRETVTEFTDPATYPDGLTFDAEGGVWVTCVSRNCLIRVQTDNGAQQLILEDADPEHVRRMEANYQAGERAGIGDPGKGRTIPNPSSLAFGGADLRTAYLGTVYGTTIACFRSPVAGAPPPYWHF